MLESMLSALAHDLPEGLVESLIPLFLLSLGGLWVGAQNALAGGGSFVTIPALMALGLSPLEANVTSTVALYPGQVISGVLGLRSAEREGAADDLLSSILINLSGGALGGWLLLKTPSPVFREMLPWLVLSATLIFIWGSFRNKGRGRVPEASPPKVLTQSAQFLIAIYGEYFGGGIGFLILATLSFTQLSQRHASHIKNALVAVINTSAVIVLASSTLLIRPHALALGVGAVFGFLAGSHLIGTLKDQYLRMFVIVIGCLLTAGLFIQA